MFYNLIFVFMGIYGTLIKSNQIKSRYILFQNKCVVDKPFVTKLNFIMYITISVDEYGQKCNLPLSIYERPSYHTQKSVQ
jgi:hypothetical protein